LEKVCSAGIQTAIILGKHNSGYKNDKMLRFKNWKQIYKYINGIEKQKTLN